MVPSEGARVEGGEAGVRNQLEQSVAWELFKKRVVQDVLREKEQRRNRGGAHTFR